jgi:ribose transport system substrate-binding protein
VTRNTRLRAIGAIGMSAAVVAVIAAASSSASGAGTPARSATASVPNIPYTGAETGLVASYPVPTVKPGTKCTIGFMSPDNSTDLILAQVNGAAAQAKKLGCKFIDEDGQSNIPLEVSQLNDLIAEKVSVIIAYPSDPAALEPGIKKANAAHIPVLGIGTPGFVNQPLQAGYLTSATPSYDKSYYALVKTVAHKTPDGTYVLMGTTIPITVVEAQVADRKKWAGKFGLKYLATVNQVGVSPSAAATAMGTILAHYPKVEDVFVWNDQSAEAAAALARRDGAHVNIMGYGGDAPALADIKSGEMFATVDYPQAQSGATIVNGAYDVITHQHLPLPKFTGLPSTIVTAANANRVTPGAP